MLDDAIRYTMPGYILVLWLNTRISQFQTFLNLQFFHYFYFWEARDHFIPLGFEHSVI